MRKILYLLIICAVTAAVAGCTGGGKDGASRGTKPQDTLYTEQRAMEAYAYQPELALRIIDSAVIVGNLKEPRAGLNRARIFSQTLMGGQLDSLLGGRKGARFDTARAIGERLLNHDTIKAELDRQQDVLEILVYTARQQQDTARWLQRSLELAEVCRQKGYETEALRTEAEIGSILFLMGQREQGMAKIDSAIMRLDNGQRTFNELDATVLALKRKLGVLSTEGRSVDMIPVARRIIERLNDYDQHPQDYHDGTYREPKNDESRDSYIRFYRTQAQNFITAAYAALGQQGKMDETFQQLESTVREATAREHIARYRALEQQREIERKEAKMLRFQMLACAGCLLALLTIIFARYVFIQRRKENRKNHVLSMQIADAIDYKQKFETLQKFVKSTTSETTASSNTSAEQDSTDDDMMAGKSANELFDIMRRRIVDEKLYLDPMFDRQAAADLFGVSVRRIGVAFGQGSSYKSISDFIRKCRLEHACQLLRTTELTISEVATASGFSRTTTFNHDFKARYELSPTDFRNQLKDAE